MRDVLDELMRWWESGETVGIGTVVATFQSAPRPAGASMLVGPDGTAVGSVSGGCVEGEVVSEAMDAISDGKARTLEFGVADETAWRVGLSCGGRIRVYVEKVD
jgi:xanthine dehydrogenase accessory factor